MNMEFLRKLAIPMEVKKLYPADETVVRTWNEREAEIKAVFDGRDSRLALIIGPCSADREDSVLEYVTRLRAVQEKVRDKLLLIPRVYTDKPRTTGAGYKGMVHQPDPDAPPDMYKGILAIRKLHMRVIRETGFLCADELLYPENYKYVDDLLGYVAVGARSVEDQQHRLTASGIDVPVGMKNPTGGDLTVMMNAVTAAQSGHTFLYRGWEARSQGNPYAHAVLRGYRDTDGTLRPNYRKADLERVLALYAGREYRNPALLVDCNHANSGKDPFRQPSIAFDVLRSRRESRELQTLVKGLMVESYLVDGAQAPGGDTYGQSITDPCLGWDRTERFVYELADEL